MAAAHHWPPLRRLLRVALGAILLALAGIAPACAQAAAGAQGPAQGDLQRQRWFIPSPEPGLLMRATVMRPRGRGPFPLVVVNHGSTQSAARRAAVPLPAYDALSRWLVERGYAVVVPQRPGHGETGGTYLENQGGCANADYHKSGLATALSIEATIAYMLRQPFVRKTGIIVIGQSAGGWGALALAGKNPPGVKAVINFAGGRGGRSYDRPNNNCAPDRLVAAARTFGTTARIPTLWIYARNDTYFAPELSKRMADAFRAGGGRVEYHLLPAIGSDGHRLIELRQAVAVWAPIVRAFVARLR
jgi:dienelactone hydrolase